MDGTILGQGSFIVGATVVPQLIVIPSNVDFMWVKNYTQTSNAGVAAPGSVGVSFYWQRGMAPGTGIVSYYQVSTNAQTSDTFVSGGFTLYDPSGQSAGALPLLGNAIATTASTNATRPVVSTANTAGISVGTVVRLSNTAQTDVNGIDMVVGAVTANTAFTLLTATNPLATAPGAIGGAGFYRIVNTDGLFYPKRRYVCKITQASNAQVSTTVAHGYVAGQAVRFTIPNISGMIQLNSTVFNNYMTATVVTVVDAYNFTINIDTTSYTAFTWPTIAQEPSSFPIVDPVGEDSASALLSLQPQTPTFNGQQIYNTNVGVLSDSTVNTGFLGMLLGTGGTGTGLTTNITGPAGTTAADVVYWVTGKSSFGGL